MNKIKKSYFLFYLLLIVNFFTIFILYFLFRIPREALIVVQGVFFLAIVGSFFLLAKKTENLVVGLEESAMSQIENLEKSERGYRDFAVQCLSTWVSADKADILRQMTLPELQAELEAHTEVAPAPTDKIEPMAGFFEVVIEIYHKIPYLIKLLSSITEKTESAAFTLIEKFTVVTRANKEANAEAEKNLAKLEKNDDGKDFQLVISEARRGISENVRIIEKFVDFNRQNKLRLQKMFDWIEQINGIMSNIENISQQNKVISLNSFIESAKLGEQGKGLKVLAKEIEKLSKLTGGFTKESAGIMKSFKNYNETMVSELDKSTDEFIKDIEKSGRFLEEIISMLIHSYEFTTQSFIKLRNSTQEVGKSFNSISQSLQFQDITRQQIEHISHFLNDIQHKIDENRQFLEKMGINLDDDNHELHERIRSELREHVTVSEERMILM